MLTQTLLARAEVITDGAWGTQLFGRAYVDAGSHIILTNTFGANRVRLAGANFIGGCCGTTLAHIAELVRK